MPVVFDFGAKNVIKWAKMEMYMAAQLLTDKQMFCALYWGEVISLTQLEKFKQCVQNDDQMNAKDKAKLSEIVQLLEELPEKEIGYKKRTYKSVVIVRRASTTSTLNEDIPNSVCNWGWPQAIKLAAHTRLINTFIEKNRGSLNKITHISDAAKWNKKLENGEYILNHVDPHERFAQSQGCAIFVPNSYNGGGFLDVRGYSSAPLSGARLFESSGSANTTIRSRGLNNAIVVHVNTSLSHIDPNNTHSLSNANRLTDAVAYMERERLEAALKEASIEQLKARLAELEPESAPSSIRRKM